MWRVLLPILSALPLILHTEEVLSSEQLVTRHGAVPDDDQLDTRAIQAAIHAAAAEDGGIVRFPAGVFLAAGLQLKSNITLVLDEGAVLMGSRDHRDYGKGGWSQALINGDGLQHICIQGPGTIDGADCKNPDGEEGFRGPHAILLSDCQDITISNVTIKRSGNYAILCRRCRNAQLKKVTIRGGHDGLHAQACQKFEVRTCDFRTGDDCYAGCDNVDFRIVNCEINSSCNGFRLGCVNLSVKGCRFWGPGEYQHQVSNRKNMLSAFVHFAPQDRKPKLPSDNWLIEDVMIDNVGFVYGYDIERGLWQKGQPAKRLRFHNVKATNVERPLRVLGDSDREFQLTLDNVSIALRDDRRNQPVLDLKRFGALTLRNVTLENSGTKPVVKASVGKLVSVERVTCVSANSVPYDLDDIDRVVGLEDE